MILIVSIPDICVLPHFLYSHEYRLARNIVYCAILSDQIVVDCPICLGGDIVEQVFIIQQVFLMSVSVLRLFLTVPWAGLRWMIVALPGHS